MNFGESFRKVRVERNMTQNELAEKIGFTQQFISDIELGNRPPSAKILKAMAEDSDLNCTADEILGVEKLNDVRGVFENE